VPVLDEHVRRHHDATVAGQQHSTVVTRSESDRFRLAPVPYQPFDDVEFANIAQRGITVAGAHITSGRFLPADFGSVSVIDRLSRK
jgi:hypothetical protein